MGHDRVRPSQVPSHFKRPNWCGRTDPKRISSGGGYTLVTNLSAGTSFTSTGLTSGVTYYYVVTALSSSGQESAYSNQASARPR